jgi:hypothetical protein
MFGCHSKDWTYLWHWPQFSFEDPFATNHSPHNTQLACLHVSFDLGEKLGITDNRNPQEQKFVTNCYLIRKLLASFRLIVPNVYPITLTTPLVKVKDHIHVYPQGSPIPSPWQWSVGWILPIEPVDCQSLINKCDTTTDCWRSTHWIVDTTVCIVSPDKFL